MNGKDLSIVNLDEWDRMGDEKRHINSPRWFRKMPPIAEVELASITEASTFHLSTLGLEGDHDT